MVLLHFYGGIILVSLHFYGGIIAELLHFYEGIIAILLHFYGGIIAVLLHFFGGIIPFFCFAVCDCFRRCYGRGRRTESKRGEKLKFISIYSYTVFWLFRYIS